MEYSAYSDPKFGVEQLFGPTELSGSLASTVGATILNRYLIKKAMNINAVYAYCKTGGTDAVRKIQIGTAAQGGAATYIGTATLGTQADKTTKNLSISGAVAAGEEIVIAHLGTGAEPWNVQFTFFLQEKFTNA